MALITYPPTRSWPRPAAVRLAPVRVLATAGVRIARRATLAQQVALVVGAYLAYFLARGLTESSESQATANAGSVIELERRLGFFWEPAIQERIVDHHWIVTAANWMYIWGHWPLIALAAAWLLMRRRPAFLLFRNAFIISGAIGLLIFVLFPVAPPRLVDGIGVVDTVTVHSHSYRVLQPPAFVNQYAAVPSLHFGWNLLIGIALVTQSRSPAVRAFGAVTPFLMLAAIVLTANHYIVDAFAGGAVALTGLVAACALRPRSARADAGGRAARVAAGGEAASPA